MPDRPDGTWEWSCGSDPTVVRVKLRASAVHQRVLRVGNLTRSLCKIWIRAPGSTEHSVRIGTSGHAGSLRTGLRENLAVSAAVGHDVNVLDFGLDRDLTIGNEIRPPMADGVSVFPPYFNLNRRII